MTTRVNVRADSQAYGAWKELGPSRQRNARAVERILRLVEALEAGRKAPAERMPGVRSADLTIRLELALLERIQRFAGPYNAGPTGPYRSVAGLVRTAIERAENS